MKRSSLLTTLCFSFCAAGCSNSSMDNNGADGSTSGSTDLSAVAAAKGVVVNEVYPHGADEKTDPDWVELKNTGDTEVDLSSYQVRDDKTTVKLPAGTKLAAGAYLIIYCDDVPDGGATDRIHVPFKLGGKDEFYLLLPNGNKVDGTSWDSTTAPTGKSYGRLPDGTGQFTALTPTRSARNL